MNRVDRPPLTEREEDRPKEQQPKERVRVAEHERVVVIERGDEQKR